MALKHVNAYEVFPPEIVEEIQKYYSVGYLLIPKPGHEKCLKETDLKDSLKHSI